jgi:Domain of unknown function (DUF4345)
VHLDAPLGRKWCTKVHPTPDQLAFRHDYPISLTMTTFAYALTLITLFLGTALGLKGWLDPQWGADLVRLRPKDEQPEGVAEFRGTFGGMFTGLHLVAFGLVLWGSQEAGVAAASVVAAGWLGTAAARIHSFTVDAPAKHPFVQQSIVIEIVVGMLILAWPLALLAS